jgi:hypothetical protein
MKTTPKSAKAPKAKAPAAKAPKAKPETNGRAKKDRLRGPQVRILAALAKAKAPLTRREIAAKAECDLAWLVSWVGKIDPKARAASEKATGFPSLLTLGYVTMAEGDGASAYMITPAGPGVSFEEQALKTLELPVPALPLQRFTFDRGTLTATASDFGTPRDGLWWLGRLYNDACDVGIVIRSELTGEERRFVLSKQVEREGEVLYWEFAPVERLQHVGLVTIFND